MVGSSCVLSEPLLERGADIHCAVPAHQMMGGSDRVCAASGAIYFGPWANNAAVGFYVRRAPFHSIKFPELGPNYSGQTLCTIAEPEPFHFWCSIQ